MSSEGSSEKRLWLVRHAPVAGVAGTIHGFDAPADLSDTRRIDALRLRLPTACPAYCSPTRRTVETARALGFAAVSEAKFREQDFGRWTGRMHRDIAEESPELYAEFWRAPASNRPPGGESFEDQIARVAIALEALPPGDAILIVHSGTIRAALSIALGIGGENALRFAIDPLSLTRIDQIGRDWRVNAVNVHIA